MQCDLTGTVVCESSLFNDAHLSVVVLLMVTCELFLFVSVNEEEFIAIMTGDT